MALSHTQRSRFYDQLGKLFTAGFPFLKAVETMLSSRPAGSQQRLLQRLRECALRGENLTASISQPGLPFEAMEISLLAACEHSGQLPLGCDYLSRYFARVAATWRLIWKRAAYPFFLLHFGVLTFAVPKLFQGEPIAAVLRASVTPLIIFYLLLATLWILVGALLRAASFSALSDQILNHLPLIGRVRRSLALHRFCTSYVLQLDAGVNVMDSLISAAEASHSATLRRAIEDIIPAIRQGSQVGPELAATGAFPADLVQGMVIGEQTGTLDADLHRLAAEYETRAMNGIDNLGEWIPKMIYFGIVVFLAWSIVTAYKTSLGGLDKILDQ